MSYTVSWFHLANEPCIESTSDTETRSFNVNTIEDITKHQLKEIIKLIVFSDSEIVNGGEKYCRISITYILISFS